MAKSSAAVVTAVCVLSAICAAGLYFTWHGITLFAEVDYSPDDCFSEEDLKTAVRLAKSEFRGTFDGCILQAIEYDAEASEHEVIQDSRYAGAIFLRSEYLAVAPFASEEWGSGSAVISWIVMQNDNGVWKLKSYGHG